MTRRRLLLAAALAAAGIPVASASPCFAIGDGDNQARIVIEHGDDAATFCLSFPEPKLTGLEALRRTGLELTIEDWGAGQVTVCRIGGIGCAYPDEPCWCACADTGDCTFWGYYRAHGDGAWTFSPVGAADTTVRDGDREGWRYGPQTSRGGNAPRTTDGACVESAGFLAAATAPAPAGSPLPILAAIAGVAALAGIVTWLGRRRGSA